MGADKKFESNYYRIESRERKAIRVMSELFESNYYRIESIPVHVKERAAELFESNYYRIETNGKDIILETVSRQSRAFPTVYIYRRLKENYCNSSKKPQSKQKYFSFRSLTLIGPTYNND